MSKDVWTPEREGLLKQLWAQGLSARQIAARLGAGISRNAVIGKRIRMGLPDRVEPTAGTGTRASRATKTVPLRKPKSVPFIDLDPVRKSRAPTRGPHSLPHDQRNWFQCPMFCAGEEGSQGYVCGAPIHFPAQKFCKSCAKFAYLPPEKRRLVA